MIALGGGNGDEDPTVVATGSASGAGTGGASGSGASGGASSASSGSDSDGPSNGGATGDDTGAGSAAATTPDPLAKPFEEAREDSETYPERYNDHIERVTKLLDRAKTAGSKLEREIQGHLQILTVRRDEAAETEFNQRKMDADHKAGVGRYDEARRIWDQFDAQKVSDAIRARIEDERTAIAKLEQKAADLASKMPEIPADGEQLSMWAEEGATEGALRWRVRGASVWSRNRTENALVSRAAQGASMLFALKGATPFKDFYASFEYVIQGGAMVVAARVGEGRTDGNPVQLRLPAAVSWTKGHVLARGGQVRVWIDGDGESLQSDVTTCETGALGFVIAANSRVMLRNVQVRAQSYGSNWPSLDLPPKPPEAVAANVTKLFDGASLKGWSEQGKGTQWSVADGVLKGAAGATPNRLIFEGFDATAAKYTVRLQMRNTTGRLGVLLHLQPDGEADAAGIAVNTNDAWYELVFVCDGKRVVCYLVRLSDGNITTGPQLLNTRYESGKLGLRLEPNGAVEIRSVTLERP